MPGDGSEAQGDFARLAAGRGVQSERALGDPNPSSAEIRDMARLLWQRWNPQEVLPWKV